MTNNKLGISIFSQAMYSSWCFHHPSRTLFDAGDGLALHLGARIFGIERIFLSHGHSDHINSLFSIIGLRAKTKGDTEKPLEIFYPYDNYQFGLVKEYIQKTHPRLPYVLTWTPIQPGFSLKLDGAHSIVAFEMQHQRHATTLGYKLTETRTKLRPEFKGQDIAALLKAGKPKDELHEAYTANTFAYCLDHMSMNYEDIRDCAVAVMDCTFMVEGDRNDKTHATIQESIDNCVRAGVKHLIAAHVSVRYSNGFDFDRLFKNLDIPLDLKITLVKHDGVLEL